MLFNFYLLEASKAKTYYRSLTNVKTRDMSDNLTSQKAAEWENNFESITLNFESITLNFNLFS